MSNSAIAAPRAAKRPAYVLTIAAKELREILRDGRFLWTAAIMAVLLLAGLVTGAQRYAAYAHMQEQAQATSNDQFYNQGDKNPHSGAHYGNYAFMRSGPLSFFDSGVMPYAGSFVFMEAHKQNLALSPPAGDNSAVTRFGELNGATILQVLMPLLIIFLGFSAFSGERERGTLRQLMSMGAPRTALLAGKALGVGGAVLLVIAPCVLVGAGIIAMLHIAPSGDEFFARVGLLALAYLAYGLIFLFITLAVSAIASSSRTALIALVGFWAFGVFLAPKAAAEISQAMIPTPSLGQFQTDLQRTRAEGLGGPTPRERLSAYRQSLLDQYGVSDVSDLPVYWVSTSMQFLETMDHEFYDYHYGRLYDSYLEQRRLQDQFGVIAPVLPLSSLSMGLSGVDLMHHRVFTTAAEDQRRRMVTEMNTYLSEMAVEYNNNLVNMQNVSMETNDRVLIAPEEIFRRVPAFHYEPPGLAAVMTEYRGAFIVLAGWLLAAIGASFAALTRLRPQMR